MKHIKFKNVFVIMLSILVFSSVGFSIVAHADDDDKYERDDEEEYVQPAPIVEQAPVVEIVEVSKPKTVTQTITDPSTTVVVNETRDVEYTDTDRDGLIDLEDPHPSIPEMFIVKDENFNGIVDTFENYVAS
jgi:hypothetical protein